jgi:hypothetical protein
VSYERERAERRLRWLAADLQVLLRLAEKAYAVGEYPRAHGIVRQGVADALVAIDEALHSDGNEDAA